MQYSIETINPEIIMWIKLITSTTIITLTGWVLLFLRKTHKKLKETPTCKEVDAKINSAKKHNEKYTDNKLKSYSELQKIELKAIVKQGDETNRMVKFLYEQAIKP